MSPAGVLDRLASGAAADLPIAVVAAHPDDETLSAATLMRRARNLVLIHLTDGAPTDLRFAMDAGFASVDAYAEARREELDRALDVLEVRPRVRARYDLPDQDAVFHLPELVALILEDVEGCAAVVTHPYEGGHPDHDAAALAVHIACAATGMTRLEFAGYHAGEDKVVSGRFHPDADAPERAVKASRADRAARAEALSCFVSQAKTLARLGFEAERLRLAPAYDFGLPPPPGRALYERWQLGLTCVQWRAVAAVQAAAAMERIDA